MTTDLSHTRDETDHAAFDVAVANHRNRFAERYLDETRRHYSRLDASQERLRLATPKAARRCYDLGVAHWVGFVLALGILGVAWHLDHRYLNTPDNNGSGVFTGACLCVAVWMGVNWTFRRALRRHLQPLTGFTAALVQDIDMATTEIRAGAENLGVPGVAMVAAVDALLPGIETLIDEDHRLTAALRSTRYGQFRLDYRTALDEARGEVRNALVDVTAELTAAASVAFAARPDLLVEVANTPRAEDVVLRDSLLTPQAREALDRARTQLRAAVSAA